MDKKKMSKGKIIVLVIIAFLFIGVISGLIHNLTGSTPEKSESIAQNEVSANSSDTGFIENETSDDASSAEKVLENNQGIIWKDEENMGIVNLELNGDHVKEYIRLKYFEEVADYINDLDKSTLKDCSYIQFKGNVMQEGKIVSTISGTLSIDYIKSSDNVSGVDIENNMQDFKLPKALE